MKKILALLLMLPVLALAQYSGPPYNPASIAETGGTINGVAIGGVSPSSGEFTSLSATLAATSPNFRSGATAVTSASGTTVLTSASTRAQVLQGALPQTFQLPNATTLSIGWTFDFNNNSTQTLTVVDASSGAVTTIPAGGAGRVVAIAVSTAAGAWDKHFELPANASYGTSGLSVTGSLSATTGLTLPTVENAVTAHAGGGQASCTALSSTATFHRITTVTTLGDSVCLPVAVAGAMHYVRNDSSHTAQIFGSSTDTINGVATGTGVPMSLSMGLWFISTANGTWTTSGDATSSTGTGLGVRDTSPSFTTSITESTNSGTAVVFGNTSNDSGVGVQLLGSSTHHSFLVSNNFLTGDTFEITPSTANGGTTFTTPALKINGSTHATTLGGTLGVTGTITASAIAANTGSQSGYLCYNTSGGVITYDGTNTCLVSLEETKNNLGAITGRTALSDVLALRPFWGTYKTDTPMSDKRAQPFLGAHQVESVDPRLVAYTDAGELHGVRYQNLTAVIVAAMQQQQRHINVLEYCVLVLSVLLVALIWRESRLP